MLNKHLPTGIGIYIRKLLKSKHGTPEQAAKRARNHGISFVAIMEFWQETGEKTKYPNDNNMWGDYVDAFNEIGIDVWLWGYPKAGGEEQAGSAFQNIVYIENIKGIILDPELEYKWGRNKKYHYRTEDLCRSGARYLTKRCIDLLSESQYIGVTSYQNARVHKNFPWKEFCVGFGSPQLYTCKTKKQIIAGLTSYADVGWNTLVPSVPAYGINSGKSLEKYLKKFPRSVISGQKEVQINGMIVWSWRQISKEEWKTLEKIASTF